MAMSGLSGVLPGCQLIFAGNCQAAGALSPYARYPGYNQDECFGGCHDVGKSKQGRIGCVQRWLGQRQVRSLEGAEESLGGEHLAYIWRDDGVHQPAYSLRSVSKGFTRSTPVRAKSAMLRVTSVIPWTSAVAAINPSTTGTGSVMLSVPQRSATAWSMSTIRFR